MRTETSSMDSKHSVSPTLAEQSKAMSTKTIKVIRLPLPDGSPSGYLGDSSLCFPDEEQDDNRIATTSQGDW